MSNPIRDHIRDGGPAARSVSRLVLSRVSSTCPRPARWCVGLGLSVGLVGTC